MSASTELPADVGPLQHVGPVSEHIVRNLARHVLARAIDEAATKEAMALGSRIQRREG